MRTEDYLIGFVVGFIVGRISKRSITDDAIQLQMLNTLKNKSSFTVNEFVATENIKGFFAKSKIRATASALAKSGQIGFEILPNSSFLNRDDTVKFVVKKPN